MIRESETVAQNVVDRLTARLQTFIDGLPEDEAHAMGLLLEQAITEEADEVRGYGSFGSDLMVSGLNARGIIIVGGHGSQGSAVGTPGLGTRQGIIIVGGKVR
jgi:hypothetical protein